MAILQTKPAHYNLRCLRYAERSAAFQLTSEAGAFDFPLSYRRFLFHRALNFIMHQVLEVVDGAVSYKEEGQDADLACALAQISLHRFECATWWLTP